MRRLPEAYLARMRGQLGGDGLNNYLAAMECAPKRALRVNTLKTSAEEFRALADFPLEPAGVSPESFLFGGGVPIGRHPLHIAGLCYVQEPSAQAPADLLDARPGMTVLDLCAAPGGKATQLAARMENTGLLFANEPVRSRAETLCGNLERLGVRNAVAVCMRPDALAAALPGFFDRILADAPCSGEGMFRKDETAISEWSEEHVTACALRQRQILGSAAALLKPGGQLVYSTCTFSREEDEDTVEAFLAGHADFACLETRLLYPHTFPGEGQFMAVFVKKDGEGAFPARQEKPKTARVPAWEAFYRETFWGEPPEVTLLPDGRAFLPPEVLPQNMKGVRILRAGVPAGEVRSGRFVPGHALAMAFPAAAFQRCAALDGERLERFLAGETAACGPALSGWCAVTALGCPVGWGKAVNGVLKNHIPKGLRILR